MSYNCNSEIKVLFACRLCAHSFDQISQFIAHKKEIHFQEFQRSTCIVFEDKPFPNPSYDGYAEVKGSLASSVSVKLETFDDTSSNLEAESEPEPQAEGCITAHPLFEVIPNKIETTEEETSFKHEIQPEEYMNPVVLLKRLSCKKILNFNKNYSYKESEDFLTFLKSENQNIKSELDKSQDRTRKAEAELALLQKQIMDRSVPSRNSNVLQPNRGFRKNPIAICKKRKQKRFSCTECALSFNHAPSLCRHKKTHTEATQIFKCTYMECNKVFSRSDHLSQHFRIHGNFQCQKCFEDCKSFKMLSRHETLCQTIIVE